MTFPSTRTYGVELEVVRAPTGLFSGITLPQVAARLAGAGIPTLSTGYNHTDSSTHWKIVTDATVPNGFEVVSPILKGEEGLQKIKTVTDVLTAAGLGVNTSTGLHVHVSYAGMSVQEIVDVFLRYGRMEEDLDWMMPPSRRGSGNSMILGLGRWLNTNGLLRVSPHTTLRAVTNDYVGTRYTKVNIQTWEHGHPTIEFRHHSGTVEYDKIANWVRFVLGFVEQSIKETKKRLNPEVPAAPVYTPRRLDVLSKIKKTYRGEVTKSWRVADALLSTNSGFTRKELSRIVDQDKTQISVILEHFEKKGFGLVKIELRRPRERAKIAYKLVPPEIGPPMAVPAAVVVPEGPDTWDRGQPADLVKFYMDRQRHFKKRAGVPMPATAAARSLQDGARL